MGHILLMSRHVEKLGSLSFALNFVRTNAKASDRDIRAAGIALARFRIRPHEAKARPLAGIKRASEHSKPLRLNLR